ncbi:MAG: hypothetical protein WBC13_00380, partial [Dokdonella sp.]
MKALARFLVIVGISFLGLGLYLLWDRNNPDRLAFHNYEYTASEKQQITTNNLPVKVSLPDLNLHLQIIPATMDGDTWQITGEGVSYLTNSPIPGEVGNSVMYAP